MIAGMFGYASSRLKNYEPALTQLAEQHDATLLPMGWDTQSGLTAYAGYDRTIVLAHSFGVCRAMLDANVLAVQGQTGIHIFAIDGVRYTLDDSVEQYTSSASAQLHRRPIIFPQTVLSVTSRRRKLSLPEQVADWLSIPIAINSPVSGGVTCSDEELDVPGLDPHNDIVDLVQAEMLASIRTLLEAA